MATKTETIELIEIRPKTITVTIVGDSDLVLNKMNDVVAKQLIDQRKDKAKKKEAISDTLWEQIITSIHWRDGKPTEFSEESMIDALQNNAPCITGFGLRKSFGDAVVRTGVDKYSTKFFASVNLCASNNLVPITFEEWHCEEKLMSPQKGSPVLVHLNRFTGWKASFTIQFIDTVYSLEQIVNIINVAGFGIGIGSGRSSGFGRYHVESVQ